MLPSIDLTFSQALSYSLHLAKPLVSPWNVLKKATQGMINVFSCVHQNSTDYKGVMCLQIEGNLSIILYDRCLKCKVQGLFQNPTQKVGVDYA